MISMRVYSEEAERLSLILDHCKTNPGIGVDLQLDPRSPFTSRQKMALAALEDSKRSIHFHSKGYDGESIALGLETEALRLFLQDIDFSSRVNIRKASLGWHRDRFGDTPGKAQMFQVLSLYEKSQILLYLKNKASSLLQYQKMIDVAQQSNAPFGICFDLEQAEYYGGRSFEAWLTWLQEVQSAGIKLMFPLRRYPKSNEYRGPAIHTRTDLGASWSECVYGLLTHFSGATFILDSSGRDPLTFLQSFEKEFFLEIQDNHPISPDM